MKCFKIIYSCGCGENEDYIKAHDLDEANCFAYEAAVEDYHCYEGYHGVLDELDCLREVTGDDDITFDTASDIDIEEAEMMYADEIETTISYKAEEVTEEEYNEYWED